MIPGTGTGNPITKPLMITAACLCVAYFILLKVVGKIRRRARHRAKIALQTRAMENNNAAFEKPFCRVVSVHGLLTSAENRTRAKRFVYVYE